ncbi:hypothetical protein [Corynebacterium ureicelerivorans]|uniref:Uncharacterized protein n=1 Tax=Corynebacterium ureicelerivorans TaxID=401472 RepID=A0A077HL23_9CORY|nr:hypothetical protein [Corynebacterium ureicelerivorans]AIL97116.1 hypothetical protein CUREI_07255 [Corynebacterium ureicelerivorans]
MNLVSWLGLGFVVLMAIGGIVVLASTLRDIDRSGMEEESKRRWGFLMALSPLAGLYAYNKRDALFGHSDEPRSGVPDGDLDEDLDEDTAPRRGAGAE